MAYSFGGIAFLPLIAGSDGVPGIEPAEKNLTIRHVPYSNTNIVDDGGLGPRRFRCRVRLTAANNAVAIGTWTGLSTGTLVVSSTTYTSSVLVSMTNHSFTPHGEYHFYDCEWLLGT